MKLNILHTDIIYKYIKKLSGFTLTFKQLNINSKQKADGSNGNIPLFPSAEFFYPINIASPKLKNLYFSSTAVLYAFITLSKPAKAETSIMSVLSGR